ncbi:2,3-bisphosphoglycerate-independent phosphoglycerate mutase [Candidatus Micrarchaeota archaeon]|nr:2,3-bisphosphoglycerate-independent phosphoglycerate mutase [Candidatus Micrarchaeota archaeon]MBD3418214.1 2,3-bisphosphoglycerate-independent phosphoglycerate mutase [Candidatus Micrarchaeota archaeon]
MEKGILLIMDGLGDLPDSKGKTPLSAAKTPNMDRMAKEGILGMLSPIGKGNVPGSDTSHLTLLGYPYWEFYCGRGPLEALGSGIKLREGDVAFRANFATVEKGKIVDRRAGRISTALAHKLSKRLEKVKVPGVKIIFANTVEHRGVLILRGEGLGAYVSGTDPHELAHLPKSKALKRGSAKTARVLNAFTKKAMEVLGKAPENEGRKKPANAVLCRGAGTYRKVDGFAKKHGVTGACVAGGALYKGVADYIGMDVLYVKGATGSVDTDLKSKAKHAAAALKNHDFVFVHVKGTDSCAHDKDFACKQKMIERVDRELVPALKKTGANIVITGDHSTPCSIGEHTGHEVPLLCWGDGFRKDSCRKFSESACMDGGLGHVDGWDLFPIIVNAMGKGKKVGT